MKKILMLLMLAVTAVSYGQYVVTIEARLINEKTKEPVEFANVRFLDKDLGTVSDSKGNFYLKFDEDAVGELAIMQVSALGFETKQITLIQLYKLLDDRDAIYITPNSDVVSKGVGPRVAKAGFSGLSGKVTSASVPLQGATVEVNGTYKEVTTNSEGEFLIDAKPGDVVKISHLGMLPKVVTVSESETLNVNLEADGELLEEVYVEGEFTRNQDERKYVTAYGKKAFNKLGYAVYQVDENNFRDTYQTVDQMISQLVGFNGATAIPGRGLGYSITQNSSPAIVLDEIVYTPDQFLTLPQIDVQNIASITYIPSIAGTVKYGTLARGGAIIIRTKAYEFSQGGFIKPKEKKALVEGNNFNEQLASVDAQKVVPNYMAQLEGAQNFLEAKRLYESQNASEKMGIDYYVDAATYFTRWSSDYAAHVISNVAELAPNNVKALRIMAFKLEEFGKLEEAKNVYQRIALIQPQAAQSFRDLAHIYKETGEISKAFDLYKRILANNTPGIDFTGIQGIAEHELQQLVAFHKHKVNYSDLSNDLLDGKFKRDIRVVLEWNDPNAEFEVQFVDPTRKYFTWHHNLFNNKEEMMDELKGGYSMEEFVIDDSEKGSWMVNIRNSNSSDSKTPAFLKYTVYKDFGLATETREVKTVRLDELDTKVTLDSFIY